MKNPLLVSIASLVMMGACGPTSTQEDYTATEAELTGKLDDPLLFDAQFYLESYADLDSTLGADEEAARRHWLAYGINQGRRASPVFNVHTYLLLNDDVRASVGTDYAAAMRHYLARGLRVEGRRASLEFDPRYYLENNPDLRAALGSANFEAASRHFLSRGLWSEGRAGSSEFDVSYYICHHSDLARLFVGPNYRSAVNHWLRNGADEGRRSSPGFYAKYYVNNYSDLKRVYGTRYRSAINQWLANGRAEGRSAAPNDQGGVSACPEVALGGTFSVNDTPGMRDLSVAANTTKFRARGGSLYIHELGWIRATHEERTAIARLFPRAPIFETNVAQAFSSLKNNVLPYFPEGAWVTCVQQTTTSIPRTGAEIRELRAKLGGMSKFVGAYFSPNNREAMKIPFDDPHWDEHRAAMLEGGVVCIDAPPQFYLAQPAYYREWAVKQIKWAKEHGVIVVYSLYPMGSKVGFGDAFATIKDLARQGVLPDVWAVNGYYSSGNPNRLLHPLGNENVVENSANIALRVLTSYPR